MFRHLPSNGGILQQGASLTSALPLACHTDSIFSCSARGHGNTPRLVGTRLVQWGSAQMPGYQKLMERAEGCWGKGNAGTAFDG